MRFAPSARFLYTISLPPLLIASLLESSAEAPPRVSLSSSAFSGLYSFLGIFAVTYLSEVTNTPLVIASFGASAVLIYDAIDSPLAQPRNIVGGQMISAFVGVTVYKLYAAWGPDKYYEPAAAATAVALSVMFMDQTKTLHPPGGATALIAVIGGDEINDMGYLYVVYPVGLGMLIMLTVALALNNLVGTRSYPTVWF